MLQQLWRYYGGTPADRDKFIYTYDQNSNRTSKDLTLVAGLDEKYAYDSLNRLTSYDRGTLSGGNITSKVRNEAWGLSPTGNWSTYQVDANGDGDYTDATDLDQDRTHNLVNEIYNATPGAAITELSGQSAWVDPAYNARGNMTSGPKPNAETTTNKYIYDAWNRMVKVTDNSDVTIAEYRYDGLNQRIVKLLPNGETNWDRTDFYYNANWQCLEERYGANQQKDILPTNTKIQWLWSVQYIDAPVLRWRDTSDPPDGTLDETLYYCNDANMNVTTLINTDGSVAERYVYDPYGNVKVYSDDWTTEIGWSASKKNNIRFCGYYFDNETGLDNPRSRYYLPPLGCMTTRGSDKYDYPNLNEYVRGNTLNRVDPSGMHEFEITHKNGEVAVKSTDMFIDTMGPIYHTETVKLGTLKPATGEVGYDLVEMTSGVSVGREILELWALQLGYLPRSEQLKKFAEGHDASKPCGSECTEALSDVLKRIAEFYNSKDKEKQEKLCCTVFDYWEGGPNINSSRAWDINQLFALSSTGFRESWRSVRVNGKCYDAGSVNYVMYGLMGKLCKKTYDTVLGRVTTWKQLAYHHPPDRETVAWLKAGYDGWDTTKKVDSITPYSLKVESRNPIGGFTFTWLPYMIGGKSKNE